MPNKIFIGWRSPTRNAFTTSTWESAYNLYDAYEYLSNIPANQAVDRFGSILRILVAELIVLPSWCFLANSGAVYQICIY